MVLHAFSVVLSALCHPGFSELCLGGLAGAYDYLAHLPGLLASVVLVLGVLLFHVVLVARLVVVGSCWRKTWTNGWSCASVMRKVVPPVLSHLARLVDHGCLVLRFRLVLCSLGVGAVH